MTESSDTRRLIEAAQAGDREALLDLYARHQGRLVSFLRARMAPALAGRVSAEDVLQETLLESARKIGAFEPRGPGSFYRWLVAIARHKLSEAARAQQALARAAEVRLATERADALGDAGAGPSTRAAGAELGARLRAALASLPERQAEAVRVRYLEGLTLAETAARLECSEAAVKALVARGLAALSENLAPLAGSHPPPPAAPDSARP